MRLETHPKPRPRCEGRLLAAGQLRETLARFWSWTGGSCIERRTAEVLSVQLKVAFSHLVQNSSDQRSLKLKAFSDYLENAEIITTLQSWENENHPVLMTSYWAKVKYQCENCSHSHYCGGILGRSSLQCCFRSLTFCKHLFMHSSDRCPIAWPSCSLQDSWLTVLLQNLLACRGVHGCLKEFKVCRSCNRSTSPKHQPSTAVLESWWLVGSVDMPYLFLCFFVYCVFFF